MKRLLLLTAVALFSVNAAYSQCTPDPQYTDPGIYPDSATGFSAGEVGVYYEQLITNIVPVDTTVEIFPGVPTTLEFDSIVITSFTGLPASLTYACSTTLGGCSFAGGETGCAIITGTPVPGDEGTHPLVISVDVYVGGTGSSSATEIIDWYYIDIAPAGTGGINEVNVGSVKLYPNPVEQELTLEGLTEGSSVAIYNLNGQSMTSVSATNATMKIDVQQLESGVYFVQIGEGQTIRFMKK